MVLVMRPRSYQIRHIDDEIWVAAKVPKPRRSGPTNAHEAIRVRGCDGAGLASTAAADRPPAAIVATGSSSAPPTCCADSSAPSIWCWRSSLRRPRPISAAHRCSCAVARRSSLPCSSSQPPTRREGCARCARCTGRGPPNCRQPYTRRPSNIPGAAQLPQGVSSGRPRNPACPSLPLPQKTKLKIERDILRTLQVNELRHVQGGTDNQNGLTAASGGAVCCA